MHTDQNHQGPVGIPRCIYLNKLVKDDPYLEGNHINSVKIINDGTIVIAQSDQRREYIHSMDHFSLATFIALYLFLILFDLLNHIV